MLARSRQTRLEQAVAREPQAHFRTSSGVPPPPPAAVSTVTFASHGEGQPPSSSGLPSPPSMPQGAIHAPATSVHWHFTQVPPPPAMPPTVPVPPPPQASHRTTSAPPVQRQGIRTRVTRAVSRELQRQAQGLQGSRRVDASTQTNVHAEFGVSMEDDLLSTRRGQAVHFYRGCPYLTHSTTVDTRNFCTWCADRRQRWG